MLNYLTGVPWKWGTGTTFLPFIGRETGVSRNLQVVNKVHFQILFTWQEIHQDKGETHVLLRLDFRRSFVSGLPSPPSGEERGLISRTAAGNRAYVLLFTSISYKRKYVSDQSILVFCFCDHTFAIYLSTAKVDNNKLYPTCETPPPSHAFRFPIVNTPHSFRIPVQRTPLPFGNPKSRPWYRYGYVLESPNQWI